MPMSLETGLPDAGSDTDERGPIVRPSLHDALVSRVRDMIIEGRLAPGSRVHEGNLGRELGVSRTPLREALKFLASEGLLELAPGRGAVVRRFSPKEIRDSLAVIGLLEGEAGRLVCRHATDAEVAELFDLHARMLERYEARDRLPYFKLNQAIHSAFLRLSGNEALVHVHGLMQARLRLIRFVAHEGPEKWAAAVADHEQMMAALRRRDAEGLALALAQHMERAWERVKDQL
jgi:DNA-binding GntR family transcriptional regulator